MRRLLVTTVTALGALTGLAAISPAHAQYAPAEPLTVEPTPDANTKGATASTAAVPLCQGAITKGARNALAALQTAVVAKDSVKIPVAIAAAQAVVKSKDDRCFLALMQLKAAVDSKNFKAVPAALEAQLASGGIPATRIAGLYEDLGQTNYRAGALDDAAAAYQRASAIEPGRSGAVIFLAEVRTKQNRIADALLLYRKALAMESAAGRVADEKWYGRALSVSYHAKNPLVFGFARDWVAAYPTVKNWHDSVRIYAEVSGADDDRMIDLYRLQRLTRSLSGEAEYARYAQYLLDKGFAGEAKAVLDEGFAANAIDRNLAGVKTLYAQVANKTAGDRASLDGLAKAALASPAAKQAMVTGNAYYGYGDYAKAAAMYRAAQGKSGVDAELANLRLGMALAASGDKAGAKAALALVGGPRAEIARYWATYAATRS